RRERPRRAHHPTPPRHSQPPKNRHALRATRESHASLDRAALSPGEQLSSLSCSSSRGGEMPPPRQWRAGLPLTARLAPEPASSPPARGAAPSLTEPSGGPGPWRGGGG